MTDHISSAVSGTIYALHNGDYHYRYVGATLKSVDWRFDRHRNCARSGDPVPLYCWFRRFFGSIQVEVLEVCYTREETQLAEKKWIAVLKTHKSFGGYNSTHGGEKSPKGTKLTDEQKAKIGAIHRGRTVSDETKAKVSAALKGRTLSDEHRANLSGGQIGRKLTDEHRAKISAAKMGKYYGMHVRWHINRGIVKEGCIYCEAS